MTKEELKQELEGQAEWRRQKAVEYSDDTRNLQAAEIFDRLAKSVGSIDQALLDAFAELFEDIGESEHWSEMLRQVGFHSWPNTAEDLLREFISEFTGGNRSRGAS